MSINRILRESTNLQRQEIESKPAERPNRKQVPVAKAATRLQLPHDCSHDLDMAYDKAQRRINATFIRMLFSSLFQCETWRGKTDLQAGQSHCGCCECAHWAIGPNPLDNVMPKILSQIQEGKTLTPKREKYLENRMGLNTPEKAAYSLLKSPQSKAKFVRSNLSIYDLHSSFNGTNYAIQINSTLECPLAANDYDQSLERKFRPVEDALAKQVENGTLSYKEATEEAYNELLKLFNRSIENLSLRVEQIKRYIRLEEKLHSIEEEYSKKNKISDGQVDVYTLTVGKIIKLRKQLLTKLSFTGTIKALNFNLISHRDDFFWLKAFHGSMKHLEKPDERKIEFKNHLNTIQKRDPIIDSPALKNIKIRLEEGKAQLKGWEDLGLCNVAQLDKHLFGIVENKVRRAPTQDELRAQLLDMMKKEPPAKRKLDTTKKEPPPKRQKLP